MRSDCQVRSRNVIPLSLEAFGQLIGVVLVQSGRMVIVASNSVVVQSSLANSLPLQHAGPRNYKDKVIIQDYKVGKREACWGDSWLSRHCLNAIRCVPAFLLDGGVLGHITNQPRFVLPSRSGPWAHRTSARPQKLRCGVASPPRQAGWRTHESVMSKVVTARPLPKWLALLTSSFVRSGYLPETVSWPFVCTWLIRGSRRTTKGCLSRRQPLGQVILE